MNAARRHRIVRRLRQGSVAAVATAVVITLLAVLPGASASAAEADKAPYQTSDVVTIVNRPILPSHLVVSKGRAHLVRHTKYGILSNEYGYNKKTDPDLDFVTEPLPMGEEPDADHTGWGPLPRDIRYAEVFQRYPDAQGEDPDIMLAVVGRMDGGNPAGDAAATDWVLMVAGPLQDGMPVAYTKTLSTEGAGAPRGLAVTGDELDTSRPYSLGDERTIVVNLGTKLQPFEETRASSGGAVTRLLATRGPTLPPTGSVFEHITHRQLWDNPSDPVARTFDKASRGNQLLALLRSGDGLTDKLTPTVYTAVPPTGLLVPSSEQKYDFDDLTGVGKDTRAVAAYDYLGNDWCCAGQGGDHQHTLLDNISMITPVVALVPKAGGPVQTHAWWNSDKLLTASCSMSAGCGTGIERRDSRLGPDTGSCGTAAAGEVPALDVGSSQVPWDASGNEDFSSDVLDVTCAVREGSGNVFSTLENWYDGKVRQSGSIPVGKARPFSAVDVAQVHGCAQLNRVHAAFEGDGNPLTSSPFTGVDPDAIKDGGSGDPINCSMDGGKVQPNVATKTPRGAYPGSVTPLTVTAGAQGAKLAARSLPSRLSYESADYSDLPGMKYLSGKVSFNMNGSLPGITVPISNSPAGGALIEALPPMTNDIVVELDDPTPGTAKVEPKLVALDPQPVALLAAPPTVQGAGQVQIQDPPEFASSSHTGAGSSTFESETDSASVAISIEDPVLGLGGAEFKRTWEKTTEDEQGVDTSVTIGNLFYGSADQDVMVYNSTDAYRWTGTVLSSSIGIGEGTETYILQPKRTTMMTQNVEELGRQYPELFGTVNGRPGAWTEAVQHALTHRIGNPGSYLHYDGSEETPDTDAVDGYCDGSVAGEPIRALTEPNPFVPAPNPAVPDVLLSQAHHVNSGASNSEGAFFEIDETKTSSRTRSQSISMEASVSVGYGGGQETFSKGNAKGWGKTTSTSMGETTGFSSAIGNIPTSLPSEEYDWNMFMCRRTLLPGVQVFVLNYTTAGYKGAGGFEPLDEVVPVSPAGMEIASDRTPDLTWEQDSGTVKKYDWELQAFGSDTPDNRTGSWPSAAGFATPRLAKDSRPDQMTASAVLAGQPALQPGQLYRWRVHATDFFGEEQGSEWEYFKTPGLPVPPVADFTVNPAEPVSGASTTFTSTGDLHGLSATYAWDFDDTHTATGASPQHTFDAPGQYDVQLEVTTDAGTDRTTHRVNVSPLVAADSYAYDQEQPLRIDEATGVLANDLVGNSPSLVVSTQPSGGRVELEDDGSFTFTPEPGECADQSFTYEASAAHYTRSGTVTLTGTCRPVVSGTSATPDPVQRDGTVTVSATSQADAGRTIGSAKVSVDGAAPIALTAVDGAYDEAGEDLTGPVTLTGLAVGDKTLCVTVTDSGGLESAADCTDVSIDSKPPAAAFDQTPAAAVAGTAVTFADRSERDGLPGTYAWDFGDGESGAGAAPQHTYPVPGRYTVRLTVTTSAGTDTTSELVTVSPSAVADAYSYDEGAPLIVDAATGVLANDVTGSAAQATVLAQPSDGTVSIDADGGFTFTPGSDVCTDQTFGYQVDDAQTSAVGSVTLDGHCRPEVPPVTHVDNHPGDGTVTVSARATAEPGRTIVGAEVSVDGGAPIPFAASDGAFDENAEGLRADLPLTGLVDGEHEVCVRADDSGSLGSDPTCITAWTFHTSVKRTRTRRVVVTKKVKVVRSPRRGTVRRAVVRTHRGRVFEGHGAAAIRTRGVGKARRTKRGKRTATRSVTAYCLATNQADAAACATTAAVTRSTAKASAAARDHARRTAARRAHRQAHRRAAQIATYRGRHSPITRAERKTAVRLAWKRANADWRRQVRLRTSGDGGSR